MALHGMGGKVLMALDSLHCSEEEEEGLQPAAFLFMAGLAVQTLPGLLLAAEAGLPFLRIQMVLTELLAK